MYQNFAEIYYQIHTYLSDKRKEWNKRGGWADFFSYVKKKGGQNANSLLLHKNLREGGTKSVEEMSEIPRLKVISLLSNSSLIDIV